MYPYPREPGQSAFDAIIDHLSMVGGLGILVGIGAVGTDTALAALVVWNRD